MVIIVHPVFRLCLVTTGAIANSVPLLQGSRPINRLRELRVHIRESPIPSVPPIGICKITEQVVPLSRPGIVIRHNGWHVGRFTWEIREVDIAAVTQELIEIRPACPSHVNWVGHGCWVVHVVVGHESLLKRWTWVYYRASCSWTSGRSVCIGGVLGKTDRVSLFA
jgi:hypothetical protein